MNPIVRCLRFGRPVHKILYGRLLSSQSGFIDADQQKVVRVGIFGSPNSGKSTLLNSLMRQYVSPISSYRQTTLENVRGVITEDDIQVIFIDTPGLMPAQFRYSKHSSSAQLNLYSDVRRSLLETVSEIDCAVCLYDLSLSTGRLHITRDMEALMAAIPDVPKFLVLNKIDKYESRSSAKIQCVVDNLTNKKPDLGVPEMHVRTDKGLITPSVTYVEDVCDGIPFSDIFRISALKGENLSLLWAAVRQCAVERHWLYPPDTVSPDDVDSVVTALVRAEVMTQGGYRQSDMLTQEFFGAAMDPERGVLVIDHICYLHLHIFKTKEEHDESVKRMEKVLSSRYAVPVELNLKIRWKKKDHTHLSKLKTNKAPRIQIEDTDD